MVRYCCDLLKNIYLCGINNNSFFVICCLSKGYKGVEENKKMVPQNEIPLH